MNKSFYEFMMRYRLDKKSDTLFVLANEMFHDHSFPKFSQEYTEVSSYLELSGQYNSPLNVFDEAWELYVSH